MRNNSIKMFFCFTIYIFISNLSGDECKMINRNFAVVELFTSEGCSDCPEADKVFNEISYNAKNIYPVAFHVTYWDYIGWKDSFGNVEFNQRQEKYSSIFRGVNYTPQVVVNGKYDIIGSRKSHLIKTIESELKNKESIDIDLNISRSGSVLEIIFKTSCLSSNQSLLFAIIEKEAESRVLRGENRGLTLKHANVVRSLKSIALQKKTGSIKMDYAGLLKNIENYEIISFLQDNQTLAILGAVRKRIS